MTGPEVITVIGGLWWAVILLAQTFNARQDHDTNETTTQSTQTSI